MLLFFVTLFSFLSLNTIALPANLTGKVTGKNVPLAFADVVLEGTQFGTTTDERGRFIIRNIPTGTYLVKVNYIGFITATNKITLVKEQNLKTEFSLIEDVLNLSRVVVTGTRNKVERYKSPIIVNTIDTRILESTQSMNMADGLNFSPGLRVEINCQNCGFTQLRMNGLAGPYSQILINSRPIFSALASVYGLEMLPSNIVDRIEVVRGGGSAMYGGNAIAGIVNIITKEPYKTTFDIGINRALINNEALDRTMNFNGSFVSDNLKTGITYYGFFRDRNQWDANGDGFSEMVKLKNNTFGFKTFHNTSNLGKINFETFYINEFRRGGNKFDLFPHQADITEQLSHNIINSELSLEHIDKDNKYKIKAFSSFQLIKRDSYYGGGSNVINHNDTLTENSSLSMNAYGNSNGLSLVSGLQYNLFINSKLNSTIGFEYLYNQVTDRMPGYGRIIDQQVGNLGSFAELEIRPSRSLTFLFGGRFDQLKILGRYDLEKETFVNDKSFVVFVPRLSGMYKITENLKFRASYVEGYRGPQAFDEDLHIETVGGAASFHQLSSDLDVEKSNSATFSLNYDEFIGKNQMNFVLEGFYTRLHNPFIFTNRQELPSGVSVETKRNGEGAEISGLNLEANIAFGNKTTLLSGATIQRARYDIEEVIWAPTNSTNTSNPATVTRNFLKTPNSYGYFSLLYKPLKELSISYSGIATGSMLIPHVIDANTERTILKTTSRFFENNIKLEYSFKKNNGYQLKLSGGAQNILNSYQDDFDLGVQRDAGYIYGPLRPKTVFLGLTFSLI